MLDRQDWLFPQYLKLRRSQGPDRQRLVENAVLLEDLLPAQMLLFTKSVCGPSLALPGRIDLGQCPPSPPRREWAPRPQDIPEVLILEGPTRNTRTRTDSPKKHDLARLPPAPLLPDPPGTDECPPSPNEEVILRLLQPYKLSGQAFSPEQVTLSGRSPCNARVLHICPRCGDRAVRLNRQRQRVDDYVDFDKLSCSEQVAETQTRPSRSTPC